MLILTRRIGEEIVIDGSIRVAVIRIRGGAVRLSIRAPDAVRVDRSEVHDRRRQHGGRLWCTEPRVAAG